MRVLEEAAAELETAAAWYRAEGGDDVAVRFVDRVAQAYARVEAGPLRWPLRAPGLRRCLVTGFPFSVWYRVAPDDVEVVAIAHQQRRPGFFLGR